MTANVRQCEAKNDPERVTACVANRQHCAPPQLFVNPVDEEYLCCSCRGVAVNPCQLPCGHDCGRECLQTSGDGFSCPICHAVHARDTVLALNKISRLTAKLLVRCPGKCSWSGPWGQLENHLNLDCPEFEIVCPFRCGERTPRKTMPEHRKNCAQRTESCKHCLRSFKHIDVGLHEDRCPLRIIQCPSCVEQRRQEQLDHHLKNECEKGCVPCPFGEYGCKETVTRGTIAMHVSSFLERHCQLLVSQLQKERDESSAVVGLLRERVSVLEQEVKGQHAVDGVPLQTVVKSLQQTIVSQQVVIDQFLTGSVVVVDAGGKCGMFSLVTDAVRECREGDTILLRQGVYKESINLTKAGVVIRGSHADAVIISGNVVLGGSCTLSNVSVQQNDGNTAALRIVGGSPGVVDCVITSQNLSCVIVESGSPKISGCTISGSLQHGISWRSSHRGCIMNSSVLRNAQGNVAIERGEVVLKDCEMSDSGANGILVKAGAIVVLDGCTVHDNKYSNVDVMAGGTATLKHCSVYRSDKCGLYVAGRAVIEKSKVFDNKLPNVMVLGGGEVKMSQSKFLSSLQQGVVVKKQGAVHLSQCEVKGNCLDNIAAENGATVEFL